MANGLIITLTGAVKLMLRFFNRMMGFWLVFTGVWFTLGAYGIYRLCIWTGKLSYLFNIDALRRYRWFYNEGERYIPVVLGVSVVVSIILFACNCYKFYRVMPNNVFVRLLRSIFNRDYSPEREGNNVPRFMLREDRPERIGFFFGVKKLGFFKDTYFVGKPADRDGHILVVGGAGSGKSACIAKNTLETWQYPVFAIDIKGELSAYSASLKSKRHITYNDMSYSTNARKVFDPTDKDGWGYDPFYLLRTGGENNLVQNAREIALAIIPLPHNVRDPFWVQGAQNLLTAAILYYYGLALSFAETMLAIQNTPPDKLCDEIFESDNLTAKQFINAMRDLELKTLAGIATELSNKIMVFATDPLIRGALRDSQQDAHCFNWGNLEKGSIFLRLPEDKLEQWASVTALMVNQLFRTLERRPDKGAGSHSNNPPILIMLDEMARLGKVESIKSALATLRSKGVTIALFIQSLAQLDEIYGKDARRTIIDNCPYKAILNATDADSQEYFSRLTGTCEIEKESRGVQIDPDSAIETGLSTHWSKYREPIIHPHEFAKLEDVILLTPKGFCRVDKVYAPRIEPIEPTQPDTPPIATETPPNDPADGWHYGFH